MAKIFSLPHAGVALTYLFIGIIIFLPLSALVQQAFSEGVPAYLAAISEENSVKAIKLTLLTALITVPLNSIMGVIIAFIIVRCDFPGKSIVSTLIEVPFAVSPVIAGLMFVLLFGSSSAFGVWLDEHNISIVFALPGIVLATAFVTFPFVAKNLIPLLQDQGRSEEEAAMTLGANALTVFFKVTLPKIKWGLFYGMILTNARAMGEFGAVAVVSGKIVGITTTMPLYIEILYNEYAYAAAFAMASLLMLLSVLTLILKIIIEAKARKAAA